MKLSELKDRVDWFAHTRHDNPEVVIDIENEISMGARPSVGVENANVGIDWEADQFRIEPKEPLARLGRTKDDARQTRLIQYTYPDGKKTSVYKCPICEARLKKKFKYCPQCGQRVTFDDVKPRITPAMI